VNRCATAPVLVPGRRVNENQHSNHDRSTTHIMGECRCRRVDLLRRFNVGRALVLNNPPAGLDAAEVNYVGAVRHVVLPTNRAWRTLLATSPNALRTHRVLRHMAPNDVVSNRAWRILPATSSNALRPVDS